LSINPYKNLNNPLTLSSTRTISIAPQLVKIVQEAVRQQSENGYPQAIILSGGSGSGKTLCSMLLLRQLFAVAGGKYQEELLRKEIYALKSLTNK
jgi:dachs